EPESAGDDHGYLSGIGAGLSAIAPESDAVAARGRARDLPRPGNSVRELYPSAHDSFRFAFGRIGSAPDAADLSARTRYLCVRGTDHADRHREEERDHDDRLRFGQAEKRRRRRAQSDLRRVRDSFPPDHDDDDVGVDGHLAYCVGLGRGRLCASRTRTRRLRWPDRFTSPDALSDASRLSVFRKISGMDGWSETFTGN